MNDDNSISRQEYRNEIESLADYLESRDDDLSHVEQIDLEVDNHQWIIYNSYHLDIIRHSSEEPHGYSRYVTDGDSWRDAIQAMAYTAMRNDLHAELADREEE
jgi:hypothetical protein